MSESQNQVPISGVEETQSGAVKGEVISAGEVSQGDPGIASSLQGEDKNPEGRGSKREVLQDLARERDKRQELEAQLKAFQDAEEERKRSEMTEIERLQEDMEKSQQEKEKLLAELNKRDLEKARSEIALEFKIPAAMADRIQGETPEEIRKDAQALAEALGPYTGPVDKSVGRGTGQTTTFDLNAAIAAHYS
ncbi:DUF4355 domain-containing protein [Corynebacterium kutscheri]|uniref:capsid assembly scaffolding protein Gp46 family protein n=1 Tax=Corynebacterium kutscheri TaxID=35755 RepID=UPI0037C13D14